MTFFLLTLLAFALTGVVVQRRLPGTMHASERLAGTIIVTYLQFQLTIALAGLGGFLTPLWVSVSALFGTAVTFLVAGRFPPAPILKVPSGEEKSERALRELAIGLFAVAFLWLVYSRWLQHARPFSPTDRIVHLSRVGDWLQASAVTLTTAVDPRALSVPVTAEFPVLFELLFFRSGALVGFVNLLGWLFAGLATYVAAANWIESRVTRLVVALLTVLSPTLLFHSNGLQPVAWQLAFITCGLHFLSVGQHRPNHGMTTHLLASVSFGIALSLQSDLPVALPVLLVFLALFSRPKSLRMTMRNMLLFLVIGNWSRIWSWLEFGNPVAPLCADWFGLASWQNPDFQQNVTFSSLFVSISRTLSLVSTHLMPFPLTESEAGVTAGTVAVLLGIPGLVMLAMKHQVKLLRDPFLLGLLLIIPLEAIFTPPPIWRDMTLLATMPLQAIGTGIAITMLSQRRWLVLSVVPTLALISIIGSTIFLPKLQPHGERNDRNVTLSHLPPSLRQFPAGERIAIYPPDWFDAWSLRKNDAMIFPISPECTPEAAFTIARQRACDWIIITDSPMHSIHWNEKNPIPLGWDKVGEKSQLSLEAPGSQRIIVYRHVRPSTAMNDLR